MADEETIELELSEDDIVRYITDDAGREVGIVVLEDGKEVEYLYAEDDNDASAAPDDESGSTAPSDESGAAEPAVADSSEDAESDAAPAESEEISYKAVQGATDDMNAIFKDGVKVASEFKGAYDDIKEALNFKDLLDVKSWLK